MLDEVRVDVGQDTALDSQTSTREHVRLECEVAEVNVLDAGRAFDLDQVPQAACDRIQNVGAGIAAVEGGSGFIERTALSDSQFRCGEDFVKIVDSIGDFDSTWEQLL